MKKGTYIELFIVLCAAVAASFWPFLANGYMLGIGVDVMMYTALATSWVLFFRTDALHKSRVCRLLWDRGLFRRFGHERL